ncbi:MAG: T9SS type A sorting domain-containing protein [Bacteroidota bacterium]|nr:T9SS type A sorting domain-containing protein [Bacteroidota bacterium]
MNPDCFVTDNEIKMYPNPCSENMYIEGLKNSDIPLNYAIINTSGIRVFSGKTNNKSIDFKGKLNDGLYILELNTFCLSVFYERLRKKIQIIRS